MGVLDIIFRQTQPGHRTTIGQIQVDATINEEHIMSARATDHPIEDGGHVTDHVITLPKIYTIEGEVSNTPIDAPEDPFANGAKLVPGFVPSYQAAELDISAGAAAAVSASGFAGVGGHLGFRPNGSLYVFTGYKFDRPFDRVALVFEELERLIDEHDLVTIVSKLKAYDNMVLEDLRVHRDAATGDALTWTCTAKQITIVESEVDTEPFEQRGEPVREVRQPKRSTGNKPVEQANTAEVESASEKQSVLSGVLGGDWP